MITKNPCGLGTRRTLGPGEAMPPCDTQAAGAAESLGAPQLGGDPSRGASRRPGARAWLALGVPALGLLALPALLLAAPPASKEASPLQGDPFRGRELLADKRCTDCHSVWGHGGRLGPDLSTAVAGKTWLELVGDFWNHTPRMIDAMTRKGHPWPTLDRGEMANLLSYLYYLRLFDEPGDASRGSIVYTQLQCGSCHTLGGKGGAGGGPLDSFSAYPSPVVLAQAMWNAGPVMQREQLRRRTAIPVFTADEMADLQAHIRAQGLRKDRTVEMLLLPDPAKGAALFDRKRCVACHAPGGRGPGPDLASAGMHRTVSEISGILWNHSFAMNDTMRARGIPFPRFEGPEMADLIAYLHFLGFFRERGDARKGAPLFEEKGCAGCHAGPEATATDLAVSEATRDPVALSAAMWNHAPEMHGLMGERAVGWPQFDPEEMEHLTAYLRSLAAHDASGKR